MITPRAASSFSGALLEIVVSSTLNTFHINIYSIFWRPTLDVLAKSCSLRAYELGGV